MGACKEREPPANGLVVDARYRKAEKWATANGLTSKASPRRHRQPSKRLFRVVERDHRREARDHCAVLHRIELEALADHRRRTSQNLWWCWWWWWGVCTCVYVCVLVCA